MVATQPPFRVQNYNKKMIYANIYAKNRQKNVQFIANSIFRLGSVGAS